MKRLTSTQLPRRKSAVLRVLMLAGAFIAPSEANATSADREYNITSHIVEQAPSVGEFDGALQLRVSPDGVVSGYYRPEDNGRFIPVTGGIAKKGGRFWIDIGLFSARSIHFTGTFANGNIDALSSVPFLDGNHFTSLELTGSASGKKQL